MSLERLRKVIGEKNKTKRKHPMVREHTIYVGLLISCIVLYMKGKEKAKEYKRRAVGGWTEGGGGGGSEG